MAKSTKPPFPLGRVLIGIIVLGALICAGVFIAKEALAQNNNTSQAAAQQAPSNNVTTAAAVPPTPMYDDEEVQRLQGAIGLAIQLDQKLAPCAQAQALPAPVTADAPESAKAGYRAALENQLTSYMWDAMAGTNHCTVVAASTSGYSGYSGNFSRGGGRINWGSGSTTPDQGPMHQILGSIGLQNTANAVPTPAPAPGPTTSPDHSGSGTSGGSSVSTGGSGGSSGSTGGSGGTVTNPPQRDPGGG